MSPDASSEYVARMRAEGFSDEEIREALAGAGWTEEQIANAMADHAAAQPPPPLPPPKLAVSPEDRTERPPIRTSRPGNAAWVVVLIGCLGIGLALMMVLAAVTLPVFVRAREKARQASCQANLKQIGLEHMMYAADYNDHLPDAGVWPEKLNPYTHNALIYKCPSDERTSPPLWQGNPVSYTMSAACSGVDLKTVTSPADVPLTYDGLVLAGGVGDADFRHNGGANCVYADGHAKWMVNANWGGHWRTPAGPAAPPGATPPPAVAPMPPPPRPAPPPPDPMSGANASERAKATACQSNLKQVALGMLMYAQDWDEAYVLADRWPEAIQPYLHNNALYVCPSDPLPYRSQLDAILMSYTMNQALDGKLLKHTAAPAETPMIFDGDELSGGQTNARFRHEGTVGVAYSDGHVRLVPQADWDAWWQQQPGSGP